MAFYDDDYDPQDTLTEIDPSTLPVGWIAPGVELTWLPEDGILSFKLENVDVASLDAWAQVAIRMLKDWPEGAPYRALHDLAAPGVLLTPYARRRALDIARARPEVKGRVAVVVPRGVGGQMLLLFIRNIVNDDRPGREFRAFLSREKALYWLREVQRG